MILCTLIDVGENARRHFRQILIDKPLHRVEIHVSRDLDLGGRLIICSRNPVNMTSGSCPSWSWCDARITSCERIVTVPFCANNLHFITTRRTCCINLRKSSMSDRTFPIAKSPLTSIALKIYRDSVGSCSQPWRGLLRSRPDPCRAVPRDARGVRPTRLSNRNGAARSKTLSQINLTDFPQCESAPATEKLSDQRCTQMWHLWQQM
jgi:hypothetical protein